MAEKVTDPELLAILNGESPVALGQPPPSAAPRAASKNPKLSREAQKQWNVDHGLNYDARKPTAPDFVGISKDEQSGLENFQPAKETNRKPTVVTDPELLARLNGTPSNEDADASVQSVKPGTAISPIGGNFENLAAGVGSSFVDLALGVKQRWRELQNYTSRGLPGSEVDAQALQSVNQEVADKRMVDAPLMATKAGKVGRFVGTAAPAVAAGLIPGAQGLAGSMLTGAGLGMVDPTSGDESIVRNAGLGLAGGGLGYGAGRLIGAAGSAIKGQLANKESINAAKDATIKTARDMGYVIPPTQANADGTKGFVNKTLEGAAGKISTGQKASLINQPITNQTIAKELGLPLDQPISIEALKKVRVVSGQAYDEVKQLGTIVTDKKFAVALDDIVSATRNAEKDFPGLGDTKLEDIVKSLKQPQFMADNAIAAIKLIRNKSDAAFAQNDKTLGGAYRKATVVLEDMIERAAEKSNNPALLENFRKARSDIAKTYSVEKALNDATGNVAARKLAAQLSRGKPLSGDIKKVAQFAQAFPKASDEIMTSIPGTSPLDWAMGGGISASLGNPAGLATVLARPGARSLILSRPYQSVMTQPRYQSSLGNLLARPGLQQSARIGLMTGLPEFAQQ